MEDIGRLTSHLAAKRDELREKDEIMRSLHNTVVDLKGQIRVAVRVRPALGKELDVPVNHLSYPGVSSIKLDQGKASQTFEFQRVFGPNMSQARVFSDVEELVLSCLHGYNVSIIAYGQTGSGKTHTMRGGEGESEGIIPRAVKFLFHSRDKLADLDWQFEFKASFIEVYNEEVYDLLGERKKLDVKIGSGNTSITGMKYNDINAIDDIESILAVTDLTRSTAATKCNEQSSRSHAVFELAIQGHNTTSGASRHACLHLVDLAGSERVKESGSEGDRFKEMTYINSALSNLQNCIRCQLNKNQHIPYRNSKLTMILRDSLGAGNSKTMVIVTLNPAVTQIPETKRSLEFAQQMSMTKIGYAKKQEQ
ncbi:kinesin motor domain protein [Teladorsagia circumcincta]|uniref:Kinesin motor domain protein n=1 Tax=Teladorsagia circumcincta TaxID=45464 RepID=A0A2G9UGA5_TELCI|nr:kinesin motor domain protein [Teladorsagia circumcincta]